MIRANLPLEISVNHEPQGAPHLARELARVFAPFHNAVYFTPEADAFRELGVVNWWMAYFAHRSAPLGRATAEVVVATFYNFAPRMIRRAIPAVWSAITPAQALEMRQEIVRRAFARLLPDQIRSAEMAEAAGLARRAIEGCDLAGKVLYAANAALPWPEDPALALWHACTLLREHRFDGHNIALAAAGLDGIEAHVAMAARGRAVRDQILPIRGWTEAEWDAAERRLMDRGWLHPDGTFTDAGRAGREEVEQHTNRISAEPARRLGPDGIRRLQDLMGPWLQILHEQGGVPGRWPPERPTRATS